MKQSDWISVKDRLPDIHDVGEHFESAQVLVFCEEIADNFSLAKYYKTDGENRWEDDSGSFLYDHVTHWISLPEPPEDD